MKAHVPALLIAALLAASAPVSVAAAAGAPSSSNQDGSHPLVMQEAGNAVASAKLGPLQPFTPAPKVAAVGGPGGPQREVFGFALLSSLADPTIGYPSWNFALLSTVAVFGLHVNSGDGNFAIDSGWNQWNSSAMTGLLGKAHAAGTKVVLTVILQDFSAGTPQMCAGLAHSSTTVTQIVNEVRAKGVDGVNLDYEGLQTTCANGVNPRVAFVDLARQLRAPTALPAGSYLSIDTYSSSAGDSAGFFDVPGLNAYADSFFVMAYDSDWSNYNHPPLSCSRYCLNPVSPLTGYYYNDTRAAAEYAAAVGAPKVILGLPYYGRYACVTAWTPNMYPAAGAGTNALSYRASVAVPGDPSNTSYAIHRDANDPGGLTPWSNWTSSSNPACGVESYWDDVTSLGQKYDLVNRDNLRGVGLWNLNLGGGSPELWSTLSTYFSCPVTITPPAGAPATTEFSIGLSTGGCSVASFDVEQFDSSLGQGWFGVRAGRPASGSATAVVEGYPAHNYRFRARAHSTAGVTGSWTSADVSVAASATYSHPFKSLYTLDGYGGLHAVASPPLADSAYWQGWNIARSARGSPTIVAAGFVLDGFGGLHPYGAPGLAETQGGGGHYWGWDIARDFAFLPDGSGGFVLDGYGGLHAFRVNGNTASLSAQGNPYWGWDIARKVVIFPDGQGGYILDGWGGIHAFGINGAPPAATTTIAGGAYWKGWDIARDIALVPGNGGHSGYLLDGYGGIHQFHASDGAAPPPIAGPYWGDDLGRSLWFLPGSASAGYLVDAYGGVSALGGAAVLSNYDYWPGWKIAKAGWGV